MLNIFVKFHWNPSTKYKISRHAKHSSIDLWPLTLTEHVFSQAHSCDEHFLPIFNQIPALNDEILRVTMLTDNGPTEGRTNNPKTSCFRLLSLAYRRA